jgi:hypothetical protein
VPAVYAAGTLGGRAMPQPELVSAVRAALTVPGEQGARAVVQKLEADAAWWSAWATHEDAVAKGMNSYYAGGAAALADVLNELRGWTHDAPVVERKRRGE